MSTRSMEEQIREIARNLTPVRPIPRLRSVAAAAVALWLAVIAAHWIFADPHWGQRLDAGLAEPSFLAVLAGLVLTAAGGIVAALAAAVPGREPAARVGRGAALLGLALAAVGGAWAVASSGVADAISQLASCVHCLGRCMGLGILPVLLVCGFLAYAPARRPRAGSALAVAGGVALGAVAMHATCPSEGALHMLVGHSLAPLFAVLVLAYPLAALVRRFGDRLAAKRGP